MHFTTLSDDARVQQCAAGGNVRYVLRYRRMLRDGDARGRQGTGEASTGDA